MSMGLCFYIIMLVWLVSGFIHAPRPLNLRASAGDLLLFILLLLLGWQVFGPPLHH